MVHLVGPDGHFKKKTQCSPERLLYALLMTSGVSPEVRLEPAYTDIIQEAVLSTSAVFYCGGTSISWDVFYAAIYGIQLYDGLVTYFAHNPDHSGLSMQAINAIEFVIKIGNYRAYRIQGQTVPIQAALSQFSRFQTSLLHDKIYSITGLVDGGADAVFAPDYEQPIQDLYTGVACHVLISTESETTDIRSMVTVGRRPYNRTHILHQAGIPISERLPSLPSWVPDWTSELPRYDFSYFALKAGFKASGNSTRSIRTFADGSSLILSCVVIGAIRSVSIEYPNSALQKEFPAGVPLHATGSRLYPWLLATMAWASSSLPQYGSLHWKEAYWRTLVMKRTRFFDDPASPDYGTALDACLRVLSFLFDWWPLRMQLPNEVEANGELDWPSDYELLRSNRFAIDMGRCMPGRSLCVTEHGYLGACRAGTREKDLVCLILGANTPFILRRNPKGTDETLNTYTLVGDCYVHGLMHGEGLQMGEVQELTIV